jgi:hypothetical protein
MCDATTERSTGCILGVQVNRVMVAAYFGEVRDVVLRDGSYVFGPRPNVRQGFCSFVCLAHACYLPELGQPSLVMPRCFSFVGSELFGAHSIPASALLEKRGTRQQHGNPAEALPACKGRLAIFSGEKLSLCSQLLPIPPCFPLDDLS